MTTKQVNKDPFKFLDVYREEAFDWAGKVWVKISSRFDSDGLDMEMLSIALAHIYSDFIYLSMNLYRDDFEYYLAELYGEKEAERKWEQMYEYQRKIYDAMFFVYGSDHEILESLEKSLLAKDEEEDVYVLPTNFSRGDALTFVGEKFNAGFVPSKDKVESNEEFGKRMSRAFVEGLNRGVLLEMGKPSGIYEWEGNIYQVDLDASQDLRVLIKRGDSFVSEPDLWGLCATILSDGKLISERKDK